MGTKRLKTSAVTAIGPAAAVGGESPATDGAVGYQDGWGPPVGAAMPPLAAEDQDGNVRDLAGLAGPGGLLLVVTRSSVW